MNRILIVDDEKDNLEALRRLLRKDFEVFLALSAEEGLKVLATHTDLDVILSDQRMPGMQGSEFLEKARAEEPLATRILLTGFSDMDAVVQAVNRGQIWRYISKPWEPDDLVLTLKQAAERSQLSKALQQSRRELERALNELRAKDWARERLLQILLHEFRTAPQILEGLRELESKDENSETRARFLNQLEDRFTVMSTDISGLLADEKKVSLLPRQTVQLSAVLTALASAPKSLLKSFKVGKKQGEEPKVSIHLESLEDGLTHVIELLSKNSAKASVHAQCDWNKNAQKNTETDLFVSFKLESKSALYPDGLATQDLSPSLAWNALFEPFVGADDFKHHKHGLRLETARKIRLLRSLGAKLEFQVSDDGRQIELLIVFKGEAEG